MFLAITQMPWYKIHHILLVGKKKYRIMLDNPHFTFYVNFQFRFPGPGTREINMNNRLWNPRIKGRRPG